MEDLILLRAVIRDTRLEVVVKKDNKGKKIIEVRNQDTHEEVSAARLLELATWYTGQFDDFIAELRKRVTVYLK